MHRSRTRFVAGLAAAALPLALLAGCGEDEPEPKFEEPTSESPSASSTPDEPEKPTPPAAMKGDDVEGAKAFVEYYFAVMDWTVATGRTGPLKEIAAPSCGPCRGVVNVIRRTHDNGGSIRGGEHELRSVALDRMQPTGRVHMFRGNMRVHATEQVITGSGIDDADGTYPAGVSRYSVLIARDENSWHVADWQPLQ